MIENLFLIIWIILGTVYYLKTKLTSMDIPNKDKKKLLVVLCGPVVWSIEIGLFLLSSFCPLFGGIDHWFKKE